MYTDQQDANGELVPAYYNGKDVTEFAERDDGLINTTAGYQAYFWKYDQWPDHLQKPFNSNAFV